MKQGLLHTAQWDEWSLASSGLGARSAAAALLLSPAAVVQVACELPEGFADFPGGDNLRLQECLSSAMQSVPPGLDVDPQAALEPLREALRGCNPQRVSWQSGARTGWHWLAEQPDSLVHWRRYRFQSAHRLPNVPAGHKCGRMHGHGFEAVVTATGNAGVLEQLDEAWAPLHMQLNYQCLNGLEGLANPTSEHLSRWLWQRLSRTLPCLQGVSVFETASCGAHAQDGGTRLRIWKDFSLDSATQLAHAPASHPRARLHGHTYALRLHLQGELDERLGWSVDFGDVKTAFKPVFDAFDHHPVPSASGDCATLARWLAEKARPLLPALVRVDLFETPGHGVLLATGAGLASNAPPLLPA